MSRQVGSKSRGAYCRTYSKEMLDNCVELIKNGSLTYRQAQRCYGIPRSTLNDKVKGKTVLGVASGRPTVLTNEEENQVAQWAIRMSQIGYGRTRSEMLDTVQTIIDQDGRENPFKQNRPGKDWFRSFTKRHPELSIRSPVQLGKERAIITPLRVSHWYDNFQAYMMQNGHHDVLNDPSRIYNADESGFPLCTKSGHIIAEKGAPIVYEFSSSDKTQITVMAAMSGSGHFVPPMLIFPGERFSYSPLNGFEEAILGRSKKGWMDAEVFVEWLEVAFIPAIQNQNVKKTVLLLVDGHASHMTLQASTKCLENEIILYGLLAHASHLMQPLDLHFFSSLKTHWRHAVRKYQAENIGQCVTKTTFARVFKNSWYNATSIENAVKGFQDAGLVPWNPSRVAQSNKLIPSQLFVNDPTDPAELPPENSNEPASQAAPPPPPGMPAAAISSTLPHFLPAASVLPSAVQTASVSWHLPLPAAAVSSTLPQYFPAASVQTASVSAHLPLPPAMPAAADTSTLPHFLPAASALPHSLTSTPSSSSLTVAAPSIMAKEDVFSAILKIPEAPKSQQKKKRAKALPKAITRIKFRELMVARETEKAENEAAKIKRKEDREAKRLAKLEEEEKKRQARIQQKEKREIEKKRKEAEKAATKQEKKKKKKKKKSVKRVELPVSDSDSETGHVSFNDTSSDAMSTASTYNYDPNTCASCGGVDTGKDPEAWVGCSICTRWFHRACTYINFTSMSEEDVEELHFACEYC